MMRIFYFVLFFSCTLNAHAVQVVNLKVLVKDNNGRPVAGAIVKGSFFQDQVVNQQRLASHQGITDAEGVVELSGREEIYVDLRVAKPGYYSTEKRVVVRNAAKKTVDVLLREIRNPIGMYSKQAVLAARAPIKSGETFGYDLIVGDFVSPYGKGTVSDLIITHAYSMADFWNRESKIVIRFSNPDDGLFAFYIEEGNVSSEFKSAYTAPLEGYKNEWVLTSSRKGVGSPAEGNRDPRRNYFLRVRSERDGNGNVVSGYYGKIYGEFPEVTYYLNPAPNDRNIEFDLENNLFSNLKDEERPRAP